MELFVGNLPFGVGPAQLDTALQRSVFLPQWMIRSAEVVAFRDRHGRIGRYGRVVMVFRPFGLMGKLRLQGCRVTVREFYHRASGNERRALNWRVRYWQGSECRQGERRVFSATTSLGSICLRSAESYQEPLVD